MLVRETCSIGFQDAPHQEPEGHHWAPGPASGGQPKSRSRERDRASCGYFLVSVMCHPGRITNVKVVPGGTFSNLWT
jgi:hypothetical protein